MAIEVVNLRCPNCGAPISMDTEICEYCDSPVVVHTINNITPSFPGEQKTQSSEPINHNNLSSAFSLLKAKLYDEALSSYEVAIRDNYNNSDAYFYAAIASLKGKRAFLVSRPSIERAEKYLQTAIKIDPKGIYYYLWAYIRFDHHFKKFYKASPNYKELLSQATKSKLSPADVKELYDILDVERPSEL